MKDISPVEMVFLLLLLGVWTPVTLGQELPYPSSADGAAKIEPQLLELLERENELERFATEIQKKYRVVVSLRPPESHRGLSLAFANRERLKRLRANVRAAQDGVLGTRRLGEGLRLLNRYRNFYGFSAEVDARSIQALAALPQVVAIEEMPVYEKQDFEAHSLTNTDLAHQSGFTGAGVTIAIIDDGIDHDHPAFGGSSSYPNAKIVGGYDFADNDDDPRIDCFAQDHGTSVAGVAAGNGGGVVGVAPDADIVFLKIQSAAICGSSSLDGDLAGAIDWAVTHRDTYGIDVISMSLGTRETRSNPCAGIAEGAALDAAASAGIVTLVASGNSADSVGISAPACHPGAVSVGAVYDDDIGATRFSTCRDTTTFADKITCYSNSATFLDLLAPSHCARTSLAGGGTTGCFGGTSSSAPYAAGATAVLFGSKSNATRDEIIAALKGGGAPIIDPRNGIVTPRIDTQESLDLLDGTSPSPGPGPCDDCVDWSAVSTVSYSNQDNISSGSVQVSDDGATLTMTGNRWRRTTATYEVTANTVVEFEFQSTSQGEIHGIGFDGDDTLSNDQRIFQIFGTQNWSGGIRNDETYGVGDLGSFRSFRIRVGESYTGNGMRLVLVNDEDAGAGNNTSWFRNVRIFEDGGEPPLSSNGGCAVEEDFSTGPRGWFNDAASTCATGAFVIGTPTSISNGGVQTQVGGDHTSGVGNAVFTAINSGAGRNDVDRGSCILGSPVWDVNEDSELELWYFHGQRDQGDDPLGDFFRLEVSIDGGASFAPLVEIGDQRTQAVWTKASRPISGGSQVQLRLQVSDGAGAGDLIEGGIDDLSICGPQALRLFTG